MDIGIGLLSPNLLINSLSSADRAWMIPKVTRISLSLRQCLETAHKKIDAVYFIESGLASVVARKVGGSSVEVGLFGRDGMTGASLSQGDTESPFECFTQMSGTALKLRAEDVVERLAESETFTDVLMRYARTLGIQTTYTALANAQVRLEERLARWLLMAHDRIDGDNFSITHEFLAMMLGSHRPAVTVALQMLEGKLLIKSTRGEIHIRDRTGLIAMTQGTYGPAEIEYERLIGMPLTTSGGRAGSLGPLPKTG
jgi:CRP-like cAMP-binding protein